MGALPAYYWAKKNPKHFGIYGFAVAAGLIAGEDMFNLPIESTDGL